MTRFRLITFNIAHGRGLTPIQGLTSPRKLKLNLRKIAGLLARLEPDMAALQEIDQRSLWAGSFDHLDYLRAHADFPFAAFGVHNRRAGLLHLSYGNALLSRHPLIETETVAFGRRRVGEKGFLYAEADVGGRCLPFVNLHLHHNSRARRFGQLDLLVAWLERKRRSRGAKWAAPPIVCGDFNSSNTGYDVIAALLEHLSGYDRYSAQPERGATYPSPLPQRTLDFILLPSACRIQRTEIVRSFLSDHRPVMVDFSFG